LTQLVVDYVRDQIVTGLLPSGSKINESEIALSLGISRHPLREALKILESEFFTFSVPRKGSYVSDLSIDDLWELTQAREMVEIFAIKTLETKKITDLPLIDHAIEAEKTLELPNKNDMAEMLAYHKKFSDFHIALIDSIKNYRIKFFYNALSKNMTRYQLIYLFIPGSPMRSLGDHQQISTNIKNGQYNEAITLMRSHIKKTFKFLKARIEKENRDQNNNRQFKQKIL